MSPKRIFTYEELVRATNGFSNATLLGEGYLGHVHKGVLPNGERIAVKNLKRWKGRDGREFQAEIDILSMIPCHEHLVSFIGSCVSGTNRLLVYEFVPNNTLEFHLHGKDLPTMNWATRMKIALGVAKGLAYLHEDSHPKIINGDRIKASNILLDHNFVAKVADFGFAKFCADINNLNYARSFERHPYGYLAPECTVFGKITDKTHVFSFGVILIELITGRRPRNTNFVDWAKTCTVQFLEFGGGYYDFVDPRLGRKFNANEMTRMIACAASCVRRSPKLRPSMSQVVRAMQNDIGLFEIFFGAGTDDKAEG